MPTILAGQVVPVFFSSDGSISITPGSAGRVSLNARAQDGSQGVAPREIYSAQTINVQAGTTVVVEAINTDASYTVSSSAVGVVDATSVQAALSSDQAGGRTALGLGSLATASAAAPPALGSATPAPGTFSTLAAAARLNAPSGADGAASARDIYAVGNTLRYRDSTNTERLLLNAADNLANLGNPATARTNLGLGSAATQPATAFVQVSDVADLAALLALSSPTAGQRARTIAPVIGSTSNGGIPYVRWVYDGTNWRLDGPQSLLLDYSADVGVTGTSAQLLKQRTAAVGLFPLLRGWGVKIHYAKSGVTDSSTFFARLGPLGTMADAQLFAIGMTAGNRNVTAEHRRQVVNATTLRGDYVNPIFGYVGTQTNVAPYPQDLSVSNMATNAMILSAAMTMGGSTDTPTVAAMIVEGW